MDFFKRHKITERMMEREREGGRERDENEREQQMKEREEATKVQMCTIEV